MDIPPTTTGPLHRSVDESFVVDAFTKLSCFYPIMSKTAISEISIVNLNHPTTQLMISFAKIINSQETTLHRIRSYRPNNKIETIRYRVLSALLHSYRNEHDLAKEACDITERYLLQPKESLFQEDPGLLTLLWSHTLLVISYLHCQDQPPTSLLILESLSPLPTSLFEDYQLSSKDFKRHQRRVRIILFRKDRMPTNDLLYWYNRLSWLEGTTASGYRHIKDIIRECQKEQNATAISWMSNAIEYIQMIQERDMVTSLQRRLQYHYRECSYLIAITKCWVNKYGGLEVMPSFVIQKLLDKAVAFNENCPKDLKAALENLLKVDRARGSPWDDLEYGPIC
ncbi:uncharacterized protein TrAtP1_002946 [Trichoderma atroviride]|uniref:uncharacterized protein n=1 Tax=Hypocrea atroviridis TaxID=63577 RepID=UPI00332512E2|nr:hypothetical protein TrAtP1_002946 [Trichoderma atroviride]